MKRTTWAIVALVIVLVGLSLPAETGAQEVVMSVYLVPVETVGNSRGPAYFCWEMEEAPPACIGCSWSMMDYGFAPVALLVAKDISQADHEALILNSDVFYFPSNLDAPVDQEVQAFFEGVHLPMDWLTPATTWRELLRQTAGMFLFNQRYMGIVAAETGELHSIWDSADLDTRLREMSDDEQRWFLLTVESFGYDSSSISTNTRLRQLVKQAGDFWAGQTFYLGGMEF